MASPSWSKCRLKLTRPPRKFRSHDHSAPLITSCVSLPLILLLLAFGSRLSFAQTETTTPSNTPQSQIHLVEGYLPLQVGNRWTYETELNGKKRPRPVVVEITRMMIKNFRSYYLFNRFPFVPSTPSEIPMIRYDRKTLTFFQLEQDQDVELYPSAGEHKVVWNPGETSNGLVDLHFLKAEFQPAAQEVVPSASESTPDEIVFKYGVGIISAKLTTQLGIEKFTLVKAEQNVPQGPQAPSAGGPTTPSTGTAGEATKPGEPESNSPYAKTGPHLELSVESNSGKILLKLHIVNDQEKMIPLNYDDDQSFDFLIMPPDSDQPLWRWGESHYFSKVKRSRGLLPGESLDFSAEWNGLDRNHEPVPAAKYRVVGVLTTTPATRTPPATFDWTPLPNP